METKQGEELEKVETQGQEDSKVENQDVDYKAMYEQSTKTIDELKSTNAGLDRKVGDLSKNFEEFRKAKETEAERKDREARDKAKEEEERLNSLSTKETELLKRETRLNLIDTAYELGVDKKVIDRYGFTTEDQLKAYAEDLKTVSEKAGQQTAKEIEDKLSGKRDSLNNNNSTPLGSSILDRGLNS